MTDAAATTQTSLNKFEKFKAEKDGLAIKEEIEKIASLGWEAMDETDRDHRLKWVGVFFRPVTPGKFMMRMRLPNGILTSNQMRVLAAVVQRYGDDGSADITTRQNIQLRGIRIEDLPDIFNQFHAVGLTTIQSGMDNVRNITGDPVAGLDADELYDTRELVQQIQDMLTNKGEGNPEFSNLPRKFNIAIAGGRDNSVHAEINDLAFVPAFREAGEAGEAEEQGSRGSRGSKEQENNNHSSSAPLPLCPSALPLQKAFGFNILVGGFFSAKRCEAAIPLNAWVSPDDVVAVCRAILEVYRDHGSRANRHKSRLMWLIDEWGIEKFRLEVENRLGKSFLPAAAKDEIDWEKRDHIGVYKQKQPELNYAGLNIPVGRLYAKDMFDIANVAEVYGSGEIRLTIEQNIVIPNIPDSRLALFLTESLLHRFSLNPGVLERSLVSCTGAQFCNFALIETKNRALAIVKALETELTLTHPVRIHWTGCPNSCGQPQVADIGLMGTKARKNGKLVEGVDIYMGGKVGKDAHLGTCVIKSIPCEDLQPVLQDLLTKHFGAKSQQKALVNFVNS